MILILTVLSVVESTGPHPPDVWGMLRGIGLNVVAIAGAAAIGFLAYWWRWRRH